jgi:purine-binding chemotaxis protein CheW
MSQFLSFHVAGEDCAIDLALVREIVRFESATRVPRVPHCVRGVVNLRGSVVPVIDLAAGLGRPAAPVTPQTCLLVVEMPLGGESAVLGLVVDSVLQVLEAGAEDVEPPPSFGTAVPPSSLLGVARSADGLALLLDLEHLLGSGALLGPLAASAAALGRETA